MSLNKAWLHMLPAPRLATTTRPHTDRQSTRIHATKRAAGLTRDLLGPACTCGAIGATGQPRTATEYLPPWCPSGVHPLPTSSSAGNGLLRRCHRASSLPIHPASSSGRQEAAVEVAADDLPAGQRRCRWLRSEQQTSSWAPPLWNQRPGEPPEGHSRPFCSRSRREAAQEGAGGAP